MDWHVLYVNSRAEKKVADRLSLKGVEVFCPLRTEVRQWSDRKKKVEVPYFQSYVFVRFEPKQRLTVLQTPGVVGYLYWLKRPAVIREEEMNAVMQFFEIHAHQRIDSAPLSPGDKITIQEGALKDRKGVVLEQRNNKVMLQIEQLNISLQVEIANHKVKKQ